MSQATNQSGRNPRSRERHELGLRVARLLAGAWRAYPANSKPALKLSETELTEIRPLLCQIGAGALAWSRIAHTPLAETDSGRELHEVYRQARLSSLIHEREIVYVLSLLRAEGIEPVLVKGWAMSRLYPDRALRPFGDIDLCVRPDQFARATAVLKCLEEIDGHYVDLHCGFERIGQVQPFVQSPTSNVQSPEGKGGLWTKLFDRSQVILLNGTPVRVLADEDHLRLLCQHLFRSGARRPAWLCDIALLVESRRSKVQSQRTEDQRPKAKDPSPNFNWSVCLGNDPVQANWIASAIGLARDLLGADIGQTPFADIQLPRWLAPAVLQQWGGRASSPIQNQRPKTKVQIPSNRPWTLDIGHWTSLYARWDNPIRAVAAVGGEFNNWPRLPYRLAESLKRVSRL